MENQEFLSNFIRLIAPEVKDLETGWKNIFWILAAFDGNVVASSVSVKPAGTGRGDWPSRSGLKVVCREFLSRQRALSGAGAKGFAMVAKIGRRDLEVRFFYGDDAEEWQAGSVPKAVLAEKAEQLFCGAQ